MIYKKHIRRYNIKISHLFRFIIVFYLGILTIGCNNYQKDKLKLQEKELILKNKELELKQKELELIRSNQPEKNVDASLVPTLFKKYNKSVFKIFVLNERNQLTSTGTGFLIGNDGYAVTNYHVLKNANNAYIELINGDIININFNNILRYDEDLDFLIFKLETNKILNGFEDYSDVPIENGTTIFTIGNPSGGVSNTISTSIITGQDWKNIQFSAPIDHGSSGSPLFNYEGKLVGLVWGGKHAGNLYKAVKIMHLELSNYISHDWSNYDEVNDPNLAGPFMGDFADGKLMWAIGKTKNDAINNMNSSNIIIPVDIAVDGNGAGYSVDKYHDTRYGQVHFYLWGLPDGTRIDMKIHGKEISSKKLEYIHFDKEKGIISIILLLNDGTYISLLTGFDLALFENYGHTNRMN